MTSLLFKAAKNLALKNPEFREALKRELVASTNLQRAKAKTAGSGDSLHRHIWEGLSDVALGVGRILQEEYSFISSIAQPRWGSLDLEAQVDAEITTTKGKPGIMFLTASFGKTDPSLEIQIVRVEGAKDFSQVYYFDVYMPAKAAAAKIAKYAIRDINNWVGSMDYLP